MNFIIMLIVIISIAPIFVAGYLLRSRQRIELLSNINVARVSDKEGLANFTGLMMYAIGIVVIGFGIGISLFVHTQTQMVYAALFLTTALTALVIWLLLGMQRYMKPG